MSSDRFDNIYINEDFHELDRARKEMNLESVLPLRYNEVTKYPSVCPH